MLEQKELEKNMQISKHIRKNIWLIAISLFVIIVMTSFILKSFDIEKAQKQLNIDITDKYEVFTRLRNIQKAELWPHSTETISSLMSNYHRHFSKYSLPIDSSLFMSWDGKISEVIYGRMGINDMNSINLTPLKIYLCPIRGQNATYCLVYDASKEDNGR